MNYFALIGAAGFVAPRHLQAIKNTGGSLIAALDPHDSVGILDSFFTETKFFTEYEHFERYLDSLRNQALHVNYVSICSPNYLHDTHTRMALHIGADAICEKPLVISPRNLSSLTELEYETGKRVYTILQLRLVPSVITLHEQITNTGKLDVVMTYITRRGQWYHASWKGDEEKSGGLAMNIGIHLFDLLLWLFGNVEDSRVHMRQSNKMSGMLEMEKARVSWFLSIDAEDLPKEKLDAGIYALRSINIDGQSIDLSENFPNLHTKAYEDILAGKGFRIEDARPSIELVHSIRHSEISSNRVGLHPLLRQ